MATAPRPSVVIINRNYPPRTGVTGESACALAKYLQDEHHADISIVTVRSAYAGGGSPMEPVGKSYEIASWYDGKKKLFRLIASFIESFRLIWKARRLRADKTIVMTDPPFLAFWASLLLGKKRDWILWSMDLFPDAFIAGYLTTERSIIYRTMDWIVYRVAPKYLIALGPLQARYLTDKYKQEIETAVIPCGVYQAKPAENIPQWKTANSDKIILGYCGNLGEAHSPDFLKAIIDHLDPDKFHLLLSLYGAKSNEILEYIETRMDGITIVPSVSRPELTFIDVHLVSLLGRWSHVCVPSKAVSAVCSESSFVFYGTGDCDNWHMLGGGGWLFDETVDPSQRTKQVASFMEELTSAEIENKKQASKRLALDLENIAKEGFRDVGKYIASSE